MDDPIRETTDANAPLRAIRDSAYNAGLETAARLCERQADLSEDLGASLALSNMAMRIREEKSNAG